VTDCLPGFLVCGTRRLIRLSSCSVSFFSHSVEFSFYGWFANLVLGCMKHRTIKLLIISLLVILLLSLSAGIYLYNKGPVNVQRSRGVPVSSNELYSSFSGDSVKANKNYTSRVLLVTGDVSRVSVNSKQQQIVLIKTAVDGAYVNCTLDEPAEDIPTSGRISIKGICNGIGQGDADLGIPGDVYLTRCIASTN
jgi:tRNA_anti-like